MEMMFDRVCAKKLNQKNSTKSGIMFFSEENSLDYAPVISVGNGTYTDGIFVPMAIDIGDKIYYEPHTAIEYTYQGEQYVILRQIDIVGKEKKNEENIK